MLAAGRGEEHPRGDHGPGAMALGHQVDERHLADRGGDPGVVRRRRERVAAAHRGAEGRDPSGVDSRQPAGAGDRRPPVIELAGGGEEVGLAGAVAEAAVIEDKRRDPGVGEALGEGPEAVAAGSRQAVGHHHRGRVPASGRRIEPGGAAVSLRPELEILSLHAQTTYGQLDP